MKNLLFLSLVLLSASCKNWGSNVSAAKINASEPRIAVIGAGAAGITAAYLLGKDGYKDVVIFEKNNDVGGFAATLEVEGMPYDIAAMFVPGGSIAGDGIQPLLKEMIEVSGEPLIPAVDFNTLLLPEKRIDKIPEMLRLYRTNDLKEQLLEGLSYMTKHVSCLEKNIDCVSCGICSATDPTENIHAWGARNGVPAFTTLISSTSDGLGAGPFSFASAATALASGRHWTPVEAIRILRHIGVTAANLPDGTAPNVTSLFTARGGKGTQRWWSFKNGFQTFLRSLSAVTNMQVKLEEPVSSLVYDPNQQTWLITTTKQSYQFDKVIVTTPPSASLNFLPASPQRELVATAIPRSPPKDVFLVRAENYAETGLPEVGGWWTTGLGLGSADLINREVGGGVKTFFWLKRHENDYLLIGNYTLDPTMTSEQVFAAVRTYAQDKLGLQIKEAISHQRYYFPAGPSDVAAWRAGWATLQGKDGLYFAGEAFQGSGVPAITEGLSKFIPAYFPARD